MFRFILRQLQWLFISPKFYIAVFLGSIRYVFNCIMLKEYSEYLHQPLNILDGWIYFSNDSWGMMLTFFALVFLLSDIPFRSGYKAYEILRLSKTKWVIGKLSYTLAVCIIYYMLLFFIGMAFILKQSFISNIWSDPFYSLCTSNKTIANRLWQLYFNNINLLETFTPVSEWIISFSLIVLYSCIMMYILFLMNMRFPKGIGLGIIVFIHTVGFILADYLNQSVAFALFGHSMIGKHSLNSGNLNTNYPTLEQSYLLFGCLLAALIFLILKSIKKCDYDIFSGDV